jgi:hypothetical protein
MVIQVKLVLQGKVTLEAMGLVQRLVLAVVVEALVQLVAMVNQEVRVVLGAMVQLLQLQVHQ